MAKDKYRPISRWRELFSMAPVSATNNLQIWLAILSFSMAIAVYTRDFITRLWHMCGVNLQSLPFFAPVSPIGSITFWDGFFGVIGSIFVVIIVISIGALVVLWVKSLMRHKKPSTKMLELDLNEESINDVAIQIDKLRKLKVVLDKLFPDINTGDGKQDEPST